MQLNAINSVNFRANDFPKTDVDREIQKYQNGEKLLIDFEDQFVNSDKKGALAIGSAVAYATGKAGIKGALTALAVDKCTNTKASEAFEGLLKKGSNLAKNAAETLSNDKGRFKKVANFAGKALNNVEDFARNAYKTLSKSNKTRGFAITSAIASALTFVPMVCSIDSNKDGIKDIAQKSQNVYKTRSEKLDKIASNVGFISQLSQTLT